ncbi:MAG: ligand-gated channel [Burkholderiales bacterium 70-64]|nr:MAG: ligand-gated channel [Burkholderiales bacterium 70-64]
MHPFLFDKRMPLPGRGGARNARAAAALALLWTCAGAQTAPPPTEPALQQEQVLPGVTVTASKRDQSLDSLNGAATIVDGRALDDAQATTTLDLARTLPGVLMQQSGSLLFPVITVRGVTSAQDFYNPALTVYVDGVPQLPVFSTQTLLGVERVELLKGPQGTLYGKSAEGGILNIVTTPADNVPRFRLRAGVASRDGYQLQGEAAGPLVADLLYGSVSVAGIDAPGDLHNPVTGADHQGGARSSAGMARLRLAPAGATWEASLALGRDCAKASQDAYVAFADPSSRTAYVMPGMPAAFAGFHQRRCGDSRSLTGRRDFGQWRLSALAAWQEVDIERAFPIGPYYSQQPEHWRQNVQEVRLATNAPGRAWDAVFGLYRQDVDQRRTYINDLELPVAVNALATASSNQSRSLAAYGDATWHASRALDLSAGLRVSRDEARTQFAGSALDFSTFTPQPFSGSSSLDGHHVLGRLSAGYQLAPAWRLYANVSQGYKPGGYNLAPSSPADTQAFDKERSTSTEIGVRFSQREFRASAAVYRIDVKDAQLYGRNTIGYQMLTNVGDTRSTGLEFDAELSVSRHWMLGLSGFVNEARFRRYADPACANCEGNRVPFAPPQGLSAGIKGEWPMAAWVLRPQLSVRRIGAQYFDTANQLRQAAYTVVDATIGWRLRPGAELALYAHNLTDRQYRTYAFSGGPLGDFAQVALGRTVGATLTWDY